MSGLGRRSVLALLLLCSLTQVVGNAQSSVVEPAYRYRAKLGRVIDGDTYVLRVDLGFNVEITLPFRVRGFNAPEMTGADKPRGEQAKLAAEALLTRCPIVVESRKDVQSFARWVADVYACGVSIADQLVAAGHGQITAAR